MAASAPKFALYVSSVPGRLASPPGNPYAYIGAARKSPEQIKAGDTEPTWTPDVVVPVLDAEYTRYRREWDALVRDGDVLARTEADFVAYQKKLERAEAEHTKKLEAEAKKGKPEPETKEAAAGVGSGGSQ